MVSGLDCGSFHAFASLSGQVPLVGVVAGRCFAGNAVLLGTCDVIIAVEGANIGVGGPAMIEGGGLGVFRPEDIGPLDVQVPNGVVDIAVASEEEAVAVAKKYLSYFQPTSTDQGCADQRLLRHAVPENRLRAYDIRKLIGTLADTDSVLELRKGFGKAIVTALIRVEGRPIALIANDPNVLGGAIDADAADKCARFLQLADAFDIPVVSLTDTPGFMVGPDAERTATVRHLTRMVVTGANITVPFGLVVLRKAYGLGAQAMAGGSLKVPQFAVSWPTGEFGPMGLEGAVKLGFKRELDAIEDPEERQQRYDQMVAAAYEHGKALNVASVFEIDDVIDPADTRRWIATALAPATSRPQGKKRPFIDTW
jgi:acetyl-CoA carboxylase carboxyltransferase component